MGFMTFEEFDGPVKAILDNFINWLYSDEPDFNYCVVEGSSWDDARQLESYEVRDLAKEYIQSRMA